MSSKSTQPLAFSPVLAPRRSRWASAALLLRRLHLYLGLFLLPWALLYGVSTLLFNHPTLVADQPTVVLGADEIKGTPLEELPAPRALAEQVVTSLNQRLVSQGETTTKVKLVQPDRAAYTHDKVLVNARGGAQIHSVAMNLPEGTGTVRSRAAAPPAPTSPAPFAVASGLAVPTSLPDQIKRGMPIALERAGLPVDGVTIPGNMPDLVFYLEAEGKVWRANFQPQRGSVQGRPDDAVAEEMPPQRFLTRLHVAHGYPPSLGIRWAWAVAVDVMGGALVFWALSGIIMWWQVRAVRGWGAVVLLASAGTATALGWGMYRAMAP
jgi:hypothetical protein